MSRDVFNTRKPPSVTSVKASAPEVAGSSENFAAERLVGMTFNMPPSWHRDFKMTSVNEGISMRELLFRCFDAYKREKGG